MGRPPKLTKEQALKIREVYAKGTGQASLARRYQVSKSLISQVVRGNYPLIIELGLPDIARPKLVSAPGKYNLLR
jgi:hypothetical protein